MISIRRMDLSDLRAVLDWAAEEGWNPGIDDAAAFLATDPDGFFLALDGPLPVAAISVVNHTDDFAFLGLYLCRPSHRGRGIGLGLWRHALAHAGGRTVGLDGVPAQQANYAASGFAPAGATVRYAGAVDPAEDPAIRPARPDETARLIAMEAAASGLEKPAYLGAWFRPTPTRKTFVLDRDGTVQGLVTVRACRRGAKIGPLVAADTADALRLIRHAAGAVDRALMIDVPRAAAPLDALCRDLGLQPVFHTARMYLGPAPAAPPGVFAVTTLELG